MIRVLNLVMEGTMEKGQVKIFLNSSKTNLILEPVPSQKDYYSFIKEEVGKELKQISLPSSVLLDVLNYFFVKRKGIVTRIELLQDDDEYQETIDNLISQTQDNRDCFVYLWEELTSSFREGSIEIKRIDLKMRKANYELANISLSINGLINYKGNKAFVNEVLKELVIVLWKKMRDWII